MKRPARYRSNPIQLDRDCIAAQQMVFSVDAVCHRTVASMIPVEEWGHHLFENADPDEQLMFRVCETGKPSGPRAKEWVVDVGNGMVDGKRVN